MDSNVTRVSLLSRVRDASNDAAWHEFEARYRELILRYALARGLQHSDAEDVCQIAMFNLSKSLRNFHYTAQRGRFRGYLGQVVRSAIGRHFASPRPASAALDSNVLASVPTEDDDAGDALWEQEWVNHHYRLAMRVIRETFEPRSVVMFERLLAGAGVEEVAAAHGTTTQAVYKVKQRIRERMKELIALQIREEDQPDE
jgi:RNA polymerase sigma-70 factor (ECF subfamily)